jgi:transcriptional regulator with XRE-family HTH domain
MGTVIMETTHIHCQHNYALAPLPRWQGVGMLGAMDYDLFLKKLGAEIKRRRKLLEMNQIDFAAAIQTDQGSVSRIENGKQGFDSPLLYRIAQKLDTHPGELCAAAIDTPLPPSIPPDAAHVARVWHQLDPQTVSSIKRIVELDLKSLRDKHVAEHISAAPRKPTRTK